MAILEAETMKPTEVGKKEEKCTLEKPESSAAEILSKDKKKNPR